MVRNKASYRKNNMINITRMLRCVYFIFILNIFTGLSRNLNWHVAHWGRNKK